MDGEQLQIEVELQGFTYAERPALLPELSQAIDIAGGWVLEKRHTASGTVDVFLELQATALPDVYGAMLASGVELSRDGHRTMAERCNCTLHMHANARASSILTIRLEIRFLVDPVPLLDLSRMVALGASAA